MGGVIVNSTVARFGPSRRDAPGAGAQQLIGWIRELDLPTGEAARDQSLEPRREAYAAPPAGCRR
jgi:hypothetical protein